MKKRWSILLIISLLIIISMAFGSSDIVKASSSTTYEDLKLTKVNDIEVYNYYYDMNTIHIDNTTYPNYDRKIFKFTLENDGFVKLLLTADNLSKTVTRYSTGISSTSQAPTVSATVYRDEKLIFDVIPTITAKGSINTTSGVNGETKEKIALDKGTYYVVIRTDSYRIDSNSTTYTYVKGTSDLVIYYQPVYSDEIYRPSSIGMENPLTFDKTYLGLLTVANPRDYYTFDIKERSLVNIKYMYDSEKRAKFVLYGEDRGAKITKQFNGNNMWYEDELLLDEGTYYCSLETLTPGDGGSTNIEINTIPYPLDLSQVGTSKNSYISVETIEVPKEVRYIKGKLTQADINNSAWRTAELITDELQFGVNKTGYYSVRAVDDKGNMLIENVFVRKCDITAPNKPKVSKYTAGDYEVTGTAEKDSLVTVIYNNREYTCTASSKGNYVCALNTRLSTGAKVEVFAQDISGNISNSAVVTVK